MHPHLSKEPNKSIARVRSIDWEFDATIRNVQADARQFCLNVTLNHPRQKRMDCIFKPFLLAMLSTGAQASSSSNYTSAAAPLESKPPLAALPLGTHIEDPAKAHNSGTLVAGS